MRCQTFLLTLLASFVFSLVSVPARLMAEKPDYPNVLFIMVDDLRPELGCYGQGNIKSPNIDALATGGTIFTNAYCNVPICGASRASLFSGIRPNRNRFISYDARIDQDAPKAVTIPSHFKSHGYQAISLGKILHFPDDIGDHWSETPWRPDYPKIGGDQLTWRDYQEMNNQAMSAAHETGAGPAFEAADVDDDSYRDGQIATRAVQELGRLANTDQPFLLAVGFIKPHLPFNAPKKYWDLYDRSKFEIPDNYWRPEKAPDAAIHNFGELRSGYQNVPQDKVLPEAYARNLIHGYHACVSYIDAQIGRVMTALESEGLADNTIVVLCGDHGWNLGEHTLWCKHCNFKTSLATPLIVKDPRKQKQQTCDAMTEFIDIFPTMCDLANLPLPEQLAGKSLKPLLDNPTFAWTDSVYCRFINGDTVASKDFFYTRWTGKNGHTYGRMLYDHRTDPDENNNVVGEKKYEKVVERLDQQLDAMIEQTTD